MMQDHFEDALKVGQPVMRAINREDFSLVASECPLAAMHLDQGCGQMEKTGNTSQDDREKTDKTFVHPIQIMAHAWNLISLPKR